MIYEDYDNTSAISYFDDAEFISSPTGRLRRDYNLRAHSMWPEIERYLEKLPGPVDKRYTRN